MPNEQIGLFAVQAVEEFPGRVPEVEERSAVSSLEIALVRGDPQVLGRRRDGTE
jgi:hypothetical protein